jgi:hypothetical protein
MEECTANIHLQYCGNFDDAGIGVGRHEIVLSSKTINLMKKF